MGISDARPTTHDSRPTIHLPTTQDVPTHDGYTISEKTTPSKPFPAASLVMILALFCLLTLKCSCDSQQTFDSSAQFWLQSLLYLPTLHFPYQNKLCPCAIVSQTTFLYWSYLPLLKNTNTYSLRLYLRVAVLLNCVAVFFPWSIQHVNLICISERSQTRIVLKRGEKFL